MKLILISFLFIIGINLQSKVDSVKTIFEFLDKDLSLICELQKIKFISIACYDTNARGKKFFIRIDEYKDGKIIKTDSSLMSCEVKNFPMIVGKDTLIQKADICNLMKYSEKDSVFKIRFAGKLIQDTFELIIAYPYLSTKIKFAGNEDFTLRTIHRSNKVPIGEVTPILAYTPPFKSTLSEAASYCILGLERVDKWFENFNINHYYILSLKIE